MKKWAKSNIGFFFIIPWLIGFLIFKLYPFGSSLVYSFTDYNLFKGIKETGLMNYIAVFEKRQYREALIITFKYAFMTVPLKLVVALFVAYILNFKLKGVNLFRTAYYVWGIWGVGFEKEAT